MRLMEVSEQKNEDCGAVVGNYKLLMVTFSAMLGNTKQKQLLL